jgi:hypothetical protein
VLVTPIDNGDGTMMITESSDGGATFVGTVDAQPASFQNVRNEEVKSVQVTKTWKKGLSDAEWPQDVSLWAVLYADDAEVGRSLLSSESPTTTFSDLPIKNGEKDIVYTVEEEFVGDVACKRESIPIMSVDNLDSWLLRNTIPGPLTLPDSGKMAIEALISLTAAIVMIAGTVVYIRNSRRVRRDGEEEFDDAA